MSRLSDVPLEALRDHLTAVESKAATRRLMVAIAAKQGQSVDDLSEWYGFEAETIEEWLSAFEADAVEEVIADVERFELPGRGTAPIVRQPGVTQVRFLDYEVVRDMDWAVDDDDLFEQARAADLSHEAYGRVAVERGETILEAVEDRGYEWPYACRGGACSNCAVLLRSGEIAMPGQQILPEAAIERGARLTCVGVPITEEVEILYNAKYLDFLDDLRLPPGPFDEAQRA
jgi:ferredoxin